MAHGSGPAALVINEVVMIAALFPRDGEVPARIKLSYGNAIAYYSLDEDHPYWVETLDN